MHPLPMPAAVLPALPDHEDGAVKYLGQLVAQLPEYPEGDSDEGHMEYLMRAILPALGKLRASSSPGAGAAASKVLVVIVAGLKGHPELLPLGVGELQELQSVEVGYSLVLQVLTSPLYKPAGCFVTSGGNSTIPLPADCST
jgi:hypothetical protein